MSVYAKLAKARVMLQDVDMKKSGENKFANYKYFELGDFMPHINTIFDKLGLCGVISYGQTEATLTIVDTESDGGSIVICSPRADAVLKGCHPIQNLGAEETYLRRYLWVTAMEIVEHDAVDRSEPAKPNSRISAPAEVAKQVPVHRQEALRLVVEDIVAAVESQDIQAAHDAFYGLGDQEEQVFVWAKLASPVRSAIKKLHTAQQGN
jgi:hypothetical protein